MKTLFSIMLMTSLVGLAASASASPLDLTANYQSASYQPPQIQLASMPAGGLAPSHLGAPVSLLPVCTSGESPKLCDVRLAAARRAREVTAVEGISQTTTRDPIPLTLLVPAEDLVAAAAVRCDPNITVAECDRLKRLPPNRLPPPIAPQLAPTPPSAAVPEIAPTPPVATDPESLIKPPRTGDSDILVKPPQTDTAMPVIKPKPAQPVIQ